MTKRVVRSPEEVVLDQQQAQRLVGEPAIKEAFDALKDGYRETWEKTLPAETEKRELAYMAYKAVADVWATLERKAHGVHVRSLQERATARAKPICQGCGVTEGEKHLPNCAVLAAHLRTQALANG
jgi:hypothetical protein